MQFAQKYIPCAKISSTALKAEKAKLIIYVIQLNYLVLYCYEPYRFKVVTLKFRFICVKVFILLLTTRTVTLSNKVEIYSGFLLIEFSVFHCISHY